MKRLKLAYAILTTKINTDDIIINTYDDHGFWVQIGFGFDNADNAKGLEDKVRRLI